jgi:hypothetical protein
VDAPRLGVVGARGVCGGVEGSRRGHPWWGCGSPPTTSPAPASGCRATGG